MNDCVFCNINKIRNDSEFDEILHETSNFVIIPSKGCFITGYILIISKRHVNSMLLLNQEEKNELLNLIEMIQMKLKKDFDFFPLLFEHGDSLIHSDFSANSVYHAHVHLVPYQLKDNTFFEKIKMVEMKSLDFYMAQSGEMPYLMFINNQQKVFFKYLTEKTESQLFRKMIATDANLNDLWNWREYDFLQNLLNTKKIYKRIFQ